MENGQNRSGILTNDQPKGRGDYRSRVLANFRPEGCDGMTFPLSDRECRS